VNLIGRPEATLLGTSPAQHAIAGHAVAAATLRYHIAPTTMPEATAGVIARHAGARLADRAGWQGRVQSGRQAPLKGRLVPGATGDLVAGRRRASAWAPGGGAGWPQRGGAALLGTRPKRGQTVNNQRHIDLSTCTVF